jgi:hypothetical protein
LDTFSPILREVEAGLRLPLPDRTRLLRELQSDLDELTRRFMAEGMSADDALARAREALVPDQRSLNALHAVHEPLYRRLTRGIAGDRLLLAERGALGLATLFVVVSGGVSLARVDLFAAPSPFLWPVLWLGGLIFAAVVAKAFQLWVKRDHFAPSRGLGTILVLSGMTLGIGLFGLLVDVFRLAGRLEAVVPDAVALITDWLMRDTALLAVSILTALLGGLAWFVLAQWVASIEEDHRQVLGLNASRRRTRGT